MFLICLDGDTGGGLSGRESPERVLICVQHTLVETVERLAGYKCTMKVWRQTKHKQMWSVWFQRFVVCLHQIKWQAAGHMRHTLSLAHRLQRATGLASPPTGGTRRVTKTPKPKTSTVEEITSGKYQFSDVTSHQHKNRALTSQHNRAVSRGNLAKQIMWFQFWNVQHTHTCRHTVYIQYTYLHTQSGTP